MRTRRGSVTIEALMVLPVAIVMILLARVVLEASLNRQEVAVFARGSAVTAALSEDPRRQTCDFERSHFDGRASVDQTESVTCSNPDSETHLSREERMWDAVEAGAEPWPEILRDVRPQSSPRDVTANALADMTLTSPAYLSDQDPTQAQQADVAARDLVWDHDEENMAEAHDAVIWEELCLEATYQLFPNVFPNGGGSQC